MADLDKAKHRRIAQNVDEADAAPCHPIPRFGLSSAKGWRENRMCCSLLHIGPLGERKLDGGKEVPIMSRHYVANTPVLDRTASRPVVVVDDLARLRGPSTGVVTLPITLDWTPRTRYDLSSEPAQRALYQVVLREARREAELEEYLNADLLRRLWGSLTLPRPVREIWEAQHPALAA